jgi:uncharacterized membrane protein HdeD (DUF308 family)
MERFDSVNTSDEIHKKEYLMFHFTDLSIKDMIINAIFYLIYGVFAIVSYLVENPYMKGISILISIVLGVILIFKNIYEIYLTYKKHKKENKN